MLAAPRSPEELTTVTSWSPAACSAEFSWATSAAVKHCSPQLRLKEITAPWVKPSRSAAATSALAFAALAWAASPIRTSRMAAPGAAACTISVSSTSSSLASHGEAERARLFTICSRAAGRPNTLSNRARSWRMSVTTGGDAGGVTANSSSTTVWPRPSIPSSSSGWMP